MRALPTSVYCLWAGCMVMSSPKKEGEEEEEEPTTMGVTMEEGMEPMGEEVAMEDGGEAGAVGEEVEEGHGVDSREASRVDSGMGDSKQDSGRAATVAMEASGRGAMVGGEVAEVEALEEVHRRPPDKSWRRPVLTSMEPAATTPTAR